MSWKKAVKKKIRKQEVGGAKVKMEGKGTRVNLHGLFYFAIGCALSW